MRTVYIGCDPGLRNHSISVISGWDCLATEIIKESILNIRKEDYEMVIINFDKKIEETLRFYKPKSVTIERFIVRGFAANITELVGIMIGIITKICIALDIEVTLITANQWKAKIKKHLDLKVVYKQYKKSHKIEPHTIDSLLIARFGQNNFQFSERDRDWLFDILDNIKKPRPLESGFRFILANRL